MLTNQTSNFKHRHRIFAEYGLEFGVGVDGAFVFGILQALGFDVVPELFGDFAASVEAVADDGSQGCAGF